MAEPNFTRNSNSTCEPSPWFGCVFGVNGMCAHPRLIRSPGLCSVRRLILNVAEERGLLGVLERVGLLRSKRAQRSSESEWIVGVCAPAGRSSTASRCYGGRSRRSGPSPRSDIPVLKFFLLPHLAPACAPLCTTSNTPPPVSFDLVFSAFQT